MLLARIMGVCVGGIGLTVLAFLWGSSWNSFHSPPLFFRIFGTFIAIPFVGFGISAFFLKASNASDRVAALRDQLKDLKESGVLDDPASGKPPAPGKLKCPNCGSSPGEAEVSPHGDVKCDHCGRWYNVHTA